MHTDFMIDIDQLSACEFKQNICRNAREFTNLVPEYVCSSSDTQLGMIPNFKFGGGMLL